MTIQILLSLLLVGVAAVTALQRTTSQLVRSSVLVVIAVGAYFVWSPEQANRVATTLGVGRGADLILYCWVVITLALMMFLYLKILSLSRKLTLLSRSIALLQPRLPPESGVAQ
jgi:hypothetical protein